MNQGNSPTPLEGDIEAALLDAELFIKYQAFDRAARRLRNAIEASPRSIQLRERLREVAVTGKQTEEAARQCLALANLYIERDDLDTAHERLLEAKHLDPRISIASGLEAIRRARRPDLAPADGGGGARAFRTFSGDLSVISLFDVIQVLENGRLTGALAVSGSSLSGRIFLNEGRIVDAEASTQKGEEAFRTIVELTNGAFDFEKHTQQFPVMINASSNTNLILDALRHLDEQKR